MTQLPFELFGLVARELDFRALKSFSACSKLFNDVLSVCLLLAKTR